MMSEVAGARADLCRLWDAKVLMEEDERCLLYFVSNKIEFCTAILPPGGRTPPDPGHPGAHEVAYCVRGETVIEIGEGDGEYFSLRQGDAILIEDGVPHRAYNPGPETAEVIWCTSVPASS